MRAKYSFYGVPLADDRIYLDETSQNALIRVYIEILFQVCATAYAFSRIEILLIACRQFADQTFDAVRRRHDHRCVPARGDDPPPPRSLPRPFHGYERRLYVRVRWYTMNHTGQRIDGFPLVPTNEGIKTQE